MASRQRVKFDHLYDMICELAGPTNDSPAFILWQYPETFADDDIKKAVLEFSFPFGANDTQEGLNVSFSFVLTDATGHHTFAYCKHASPTCLVVVTARPWSTFYEKLLKHIYDVMNNETEEVLQLLLQQAYKHPVPTSSETIVLQSTISKNIFQCKTPNTDALPSIQESRDLQELYSNISITQMVVIYASLLRERRIIFVGSKINQVSACVLAITYLIFPMHWQHIFIPILPIHLSSYLYAPMPFIIGVPRRVMESIVDIDLSECVIVDIDTKHVTNPFTETDDLPRDVKFMLRQQLERNQHDFGDGLIRSFLRATVALIGEYRLGFKQADRLIQFDYDKFVMAQRPSLQSYLNDMRHLQIFREFINERLDTINRGECIDDEFEREARVFEFKGIRKRDMMKEKGSKALTGLRDKMNNLTKDATLMPIIAGPGKGSSSQLKASSLKDPLRYNISSMDAKTKMSNSSLKYASSFNNPYNKYSSYDEDSPSTSEAHQGLEKSLDNDIATHLYPNLSSNLAEAVPVTNEMLLIDWNDIATKRTNQNDNKKVNINDIDESFFDPLATSSIIPHTPSSKSSSKSSPMAIDPLASLSTIHQHYPALSNSNKESPFMHSNARGNSGPGSISSSPRVSSWANTSILDVTPRSFTQHNASWVQFD